MNIQIPEDYICILNYISRCDYIFNQGFSEIEYENNKLSEITDNSTIYCWSGYLNPLFSFLYDSNLKNITLISGCDDHPVNPNGTVMGFPIRPQYSIIPCPPNITKWFGQNSEICSDFMKPMPIGPNFFPVSGKEMSKHKIKIERDKLLFLNFNKSTNPHQRDFIEKIISRNFKIDPNPLTEMSLFYKNLQEHKFSICPPGNGKDTHRAWESLFFGCIPIVEKNNMNDFYAQYFPFLVIDRWSNLNQKFLNYEYERIMDKEWNLDLLDVDNFFDYFNIQRSEKHKKYKDIIRKIKTASPDGSKNKLYL